MSTSTAPRSDSMDSKVRSTVAGSPNLIGHGVWMIASDGRPRVVWHAKGVGSEYFDWTRFDDFLARGRVLLKCFADFKADCEEGIAEEKTHAELPPKNK